MQYLMKIFACGVRRRVFRRVDGSLQDDKVAYAVGCSVEWTDPYRMTK